MALADYFSRNATAALQALGQLDEQLLAQKLGEVRVGLTFGPTAAQSEEGRQLLDLAVRLLARFYPSMSIRSRGSDSLAEDLRNLAGGINPAISLDSAVPDIEIAVGPDAPTSGGTTLYTGSDGWDALLSTSHPQALGNSSNPFGAGAAACFACANVFRSVFLERPENLIDRDLVFSLLDLRPNKTSADGALQNLRLDSDVVLAGVGAVGNATVWALSRVPVVGRVQLVDPERIDLSNMQRYVLTTREDEGQQKGALATRYLTHSLLGVPQSLTWAEFVESNGYAWPRVLVALDSARDRRAVQSSLPGWIANAWTQPGDLGLSVHSPLPGEGACLACLYLPDGAIENEDEIVARALGVQDRLLQVRTLLYSAGPVPADLLDAVAEGLDVDRDKLEAFSGRPVRELYVEGLCGGALLPLRELGAPRREVHVPLAHQSALAGVLLAASLVRDLLGRSPDRTETTRIDLMRTLGSIPTQSAAKDGRGICICQDSDYCEAYTRKYPHLLHAPKESNPSRVRARRSGPKKADSATSPNAN